ncbi:MAG: hypothetical protein WBD03_00560, partial [Thermoplasmata archaeon]
VMSERDGEDFVTRLLTERGPLSTMEIEMLSRAMETRCPDQTVLFLAKMRSNGLIEGGVSIEKKGWLWRLSGDAQTPPG